MPRVTPKHQRRRFLGATVEEHERELAKRHDAAKDFAEGKRELLEEVAARHGIPHSSRKSIYEQPGGEKYSYFRDMLTVTAESARNTSQGVDSRLVDMLGGGGSLRHPQHGGPDEARARLATVEHRSMSTTNTAGGGFTNNVAPRFVSDQFAAAARSAAVLTGLLPTEPLPDTGLDLYTARITTGLTATPQATQNSSLSNTDIVEAKTQTSPIAWIAGYADLSVQLISQATPQMADVVLARDLGSAIATQVESQILAGSGTSGQMLGLLSVTGIGTTSYTDSTPTQAEAMPQFMSAYSSLAASLGKTADLLCLHPRRSAWFGNWRDSATGMQSNLRWPCAMREIPAIATNYSFGGNTNEDQAIFLRTDELPIALGPVSFAVYPEVNSSSGTVRFEASLFGASLFGRRPEAVQAVRGSGLATPSFT